MEADHSSARPEPNALAADAVAHVHAVGAANEVLARISSGTAHPDALADGLLAVLAATSDDDRPAAVRGYLRAVAKHLEALELRLQLGRSAVPESMGAPD